MHTDKDDATMYLTLSHYTGHSVRYLRVRAMVRTALVTVALIFPFAHALTK